MEERARARCSTTALVLGAGFSKCADIPVQAELSSLILSDKHASPVDQVITRVIEDFLHEVFGWRKGLPLPALEDIFTLIDLSAGSGHHLGIKYTPKLLRAVRRMAIHRLFSVLDRPFSYSPEIDRLLRSLCGGSPNAASCGFVVLNWDVILEKHLMRIHPGVAIDYCCPCYDWNAPTASPQGTGIPVCKMNGSGNWSYCDNCRSLYYDLDKKMSLRAKAELIPSDFGLFDSQFAAPRFDETMGVSAHERQCHFCGNQLSSHIATFSYRKSFRTPAYASIWYQAEKLLSDADHWLFVGYSLPEADYEFKHLLKVAQLRMAHSSPVRNRRIEVVLRDDPATRVQFERFFGPDRITFYEGGLAHYVSQCRLAA